MCDVMVCCNPDNEVIHVLLEIAKYSIFKQVSKQSRKNHLLILSEHLQRSESSEKIFAATKNYFAE